MAAVAETGTSDIAREGRRAKEERGRARCRGAIPAGALTTKTSALSFRARGTGVAKAVDMEADMARAMVRAAVVTMARVAMADMVVVVMVGMGASKGSRGSSSPSSPPSTRTAKTRPSCRSTAWSRGSSSMVSLAATVNEI